MASPSASVWATPPRCELGTPAGDGGRGIGSPGRGLGDDTSDALEHRSLPTVVLRVGVGAKDIGDYLRAAVSHQLDKDGQQLSGRIRVGAVAEHDVEQDDRNLGIASLLAHQVDARGRIDHRVGAADGILLRPEVEQDVGARGCRQ
jgi:hypothetical protein